MITYVHPQTGKTVRHRPWTSGELKQLAELSEAGLTISAIAKVIGRDSSGSVRFAMRQYRIPYDTSRPRISYRPDGAVRSAPGGRRWTDEEDAELVKLARQGLPAAEIARMIPGRGRSGVYKRLKFKGWWHLYQPERRPRQPVTFDLDDTDEL